MPAVSFKREPARCISRAAQKARPIALSERARFSPDAIGDPDMGIAENIRRDAIPSAEKAG